MANLTSTPADNVLQSVITYNDSLLAQFLNDNPWVSTTNTRFKNPQDWSGNLGDTVSFDVFPQFVANDTLVVTDQAAIQRVKSLSVDKAKNVAYPFTAQQFLFNVKDYMSKFGKSAMAELGTKVGTDIAQNAIDYTFRCYDATSGGIQSFQQIAQILANFRTYGVPKTDTKMYLYDVTIPAIVGSGLNQFAPKRNDEMANSWELGSFSRCDFYETNILSTHVAGTAQGNTLTIAAINAAGDEIDFTGAGNAKTLKVGDILTFDASHATGLYWVSQIGHIVTNQLVQVRVTELVTSESNGDVTVSIYPALVGDRDTGAYNINIEDLDDLVGTTATIQASHRAALVTAGNPLFLAMPALPPEVPYPSSTSSDPDSGVSLRSYYGCVFGENKQRYVHDVIYGSTLVDQYAMRIALPL